MFTIPRTILVLLTLILSVSGIAVPENVPHSVRKLMKTSRKFHASVDVQLESAEQRLKLLERELSRQKERRSLLNRSLRSSLLSADLRLDESRNACNAVRNFNRSVLECARVPVVEENIENLSKICDESSDPGACFANRLVNFEVLKLVFKYRCKEVTRLEMTISTTQSVCDDLRRRVEGRLVIKSSRNPVVMELKGVLIGLNFLHREIKMVKAQIAAFIPPTPTSEPEVSVSPYYEVLI